MNLTELGQWRKAHPNAPLYQIAKINQQIHLVAHAGPRRFTTKCGLKGDSDQHVSVFLVPGHLVTCKECANDPDFIVEQKKVEKDDSQK